MSKIAIKQEAFTRRVFLTGNPTQSYLDTYTVKSRAVATACASRLLTHANVKTLLLELEQKAENAAIMDKQEILKTLSIIGRAKLTDFMTAGADGSWVDIGPENEHAGALQEITSRTEYDKDTATAAIITRIKLLSPIQAMQEIAKLRGDYAPEKFAHLIRTVPGELTDAELNDIARDNKGRRSLGTSEEASS